MILQIFVGLCLAAVILTAFLYFRVSLENDKLRSKVDILTHNNMVFASENVKLAEDRVKALKDAQHAYQCAAYWQKQCFDLQDWVTNTYSSKPSFTVN